MGSKREDGVVGRIGEECEVGDDGREGAKSDGEAEFGWSREEDRQVRFERRGEEEERGWTNEETGPCIWK